MKTSLSSKIPVAILGATGMVGQQFISLLENHPWFVIGSVAASSQSRGKSYAQAVENRWAQATPIPERIKEMQVLAVEDDMAAIASSCRLVFSAFDGDKAMIRNTEMAYAEAGLPVVSNNSAHRWTEDVAMLIPEINPHHTELIDIQKSQRGFSSGFVVAKPNCSIQCYVPLLKAWQAFAPQRVMVATYQAISGAGKTFASWPEMADNVIPFISGEEEKSQQEPGKILGQVVDGKIVPASLPVISATCVRVPVSDGHLASLHVEFAKPADKQKLIAALHNFPNPLSDLQLPSAPQPFISYLEQDDRPQPRLDRDLHNGMAISVGRLRPDPILDWKCVCLSHNTVRGAAGGSILNAELLYRKNYIQ